MEVQSSTATAPPWVFNQVFNALEESSSEQSTLKGEAWVVIRGGWVSVTVKVAVVEEELVGVPHPSVTVKVTGPEVALHPLGALPTKLSDQTSWAEDWQSSTAIAPPWLDLQVLNAVVEEEEHSTPWLAAGVVIRGPLVSLMVKVAEVVAALPQLSVAVYTTTTESEHPRVKSPST
jgi:hypothetical protein